MRASRFALGAGERFGDLAGAAFFDDAFLASGTAVFFLAAIFAGWETFAFDFAADFEGFAFEAFADAFALFCGVPVGIISPTACMAFEPASITAPAADVATSPIRWRTPLEVFFLGINSPSVFRLMVGWLFWNRSEHILGFRCRVSYSFPLNYRISDSPLPEWPMVQFICVGV